MIKGELNGKSVNYKLLWMNMLFISIFFICKMMIVFLTTQVLVFLDHIFEMIGVQGVQ